MLRRLTLVLLAAFLVGGVAQAWLWRLGVEPLTAVVNTQFAWAVILYAAGWAAPRRTRWAALTGAVTGAVLIGGYYLCQALADGTGSATAQFAKSHGVAWVVATIAVGIVLGVLGGWSARAGDRPVRAAFALFTMAAALVLGPLLLVGLYGGEVSATSRLVVPVAYGVIGVALALHAVRRVPCHYLARGAAAALVASAAGLGVLVLLMTRVLYRTF